VIDDVLDYDGDEASMGKNLGDDLREGKVTLPMIHALESTRGDDHALLVAAIQDTSDAHLPRVLELIRSTGGVLAARSAAESEAKRAIAAAQRLPSNPHQMALIELASSLLGRQS
jgi:octaprenyl-diphosphate synthase